MERMGCIIQDLGPPQPSHRRRGAWIDRIGCTSQPQEQMLRDRGLRGCLSLQHRNTPGPRAEIYWSGRVSSQKSQHLGYYLTAEYCSIDGRPPSSQKVNSRP